MRMFFSAQLFIFAILLASPQLDAAVECVGPTALAEARLEKLLQRTLPKRGLSMDCVSLEPEDGPATFYQFAVREIHGGKCPGDPETAPVIDRYRVPKKDGKIQRWNPIDDSWK